MAAVAVLILYLAWLLSWSGTFATTCTGSDPKSLAGGMILSALPYLVCMLLLWLCRLERAGLILSIPLFPLMSWQAIWGARLFVIHNIDGRSACTLIDGMDMGIARGGAWEQFYAPYYFFVSVLSMILIVYSYKRVRRSGAKSVKLDIFD